MIRHRVLVSAAALAAACTGEVHATLPDAAPSESPDAADGPGAPADAAIATPDAAVDPGAPDAAPAGGCSGAALCEDFESTPVGSTPAAGWSVLTPNCSGTGAIAVTEAQAHTGARALQVTGAGGYCNHVFLGRALPATSGVVHGRFHVRFDDALGDGHVTFVTLRDEADGKDLRLGGQSRILMWNRERDDATLPALSPAGIALSVTPAVDTWHCVQFAVDGAAGTLTTRVDGALVTGLVVDATPTPDVDEPWLRPGAWRPQLTDVRFGWESYGAQAMTLWFDDVALGDAPIPCE